ncbi:RNA polymerase sigma-70 factor [Puteibacter caeruleilacunae]|nr:RNA polymerase sigma-70 factor [Puteibacter caeruleilacunae]
MGVTKGVPYQLTDKPMFGRFFKRHYHAACLAALKYVKDISIAEDLVQEVFLNLWEGRENYAVNTNLKAYLFTSVRNRALNFVQREKTDTLSLDVDPAVEMKQENESVNRDEELAVKIASGMKLLPPRCQQIFRLAYLDGYTYQEIADELSVSKNTVKTQMGIAYRILREQLKEYVVGLFNMLFLKKIKKK